MAETTFADIKETLHRYIAHKQKLAQVDRFGYYSQYSRKVSLDKLRQLDFWLQKQIPPQREALKFILMNDNALLQVLPNPNNKSYESQVNTYISIVTQCKELLGMSGKAN